MKFFVSHEFKKGVKKLVKDHNKKAIASLKEAIKILCDYKQKNVSFNNNHRLVNSLYNEIHIGGFNSDILFVWKYDEGSNSIAVTLQGRDITSHSDIKKKNYKKEVDYEEFDVNKLDDSLRLVWIITPNGLENINYKDWLNSKYNNDYIISIIDKIKSLTSFINTLKIESIDPHRKKIQHEFCSAITKIKNDIEKVSKNDKHLVDQIDITIKMLNINSYLSSLNKALKNKADLIDKNDNSSIRSFLLSLNETLKNLMNDFSFDNETTSSLDEKINSLCEYYMNKYSSEDITWTIEYDRYEIYIRLESYSLPEDDFSFVSNIDIEEGDDIKDIEEVLNEEMNLLLDDFKYELESYDEDFIDQLENS